MQTKVLWCATCRQDNSLHLHEQVCCSRFKCREKDNAQQTRANLRKTQNRWFVFQSKRTCMYHQHELQQNAAFIYQKKKRAVMVPAIHDAVWSKTMLWTGIVLWSLMRVQTSHSFCVASWMLDLLTVQVPIWNTTYLFVLVWLCEMLFVFKNDYWAHFLFVWDKVTPPHVAHIVTPFLHTSPITGETRFFCRQVSATPHGRFWMYSLFKPDEFST